MYKMGCFIGKGIETDEDVYSTNALVIIETDEDVYSTNALEFR